MLVLLGLFGCNDYELSNPNDGTEDAADEDTRWWADPGVLDTDSDDGTDGPSNPDGGEWDDEDTDDNHDDDDDDDTDEKDTEPDTEEFDGPDSLPKDTILDSCPSKLTAEWDSGELIILGTDTGAVSGNMEAPADGLYHLYDYAVAESGAHQTNESIYIRVINDLNPTGEPEWSNCGSEWVVADTDNHGSLPSGSLVYLGTFQLQKGTNTVQMRHYCNLYFAGECPSFHNSGTTCESGGWNSAHLLGAGFCLTW